MQDDVETPEGSVYSLSDKEFFRKNIEEQSKFSGMKTIPSNQVVSEYT